MQLPDLPTEDPREVLLAARVVAVLGAHDDPARPACYVPEYLFHQGFRILPVNPTQVGQVWWGEPVRPRLDGIAEPVDMVVVFRRAELLAEHLEDILAMSPRPRWVWLQLGIRHHEFTRTLRAVGIGVVQDRCTLADHRRFGLGAVQRAR